MIIVNLTGGLGNQMFQYAAAKRVSIKTNSILKLHFTDALFCTSRRYLLDCFSLKENFATNKEIRLMGFPTSLFGRFVFRLMKELKLNFLYQKVISESPKFHDKNSLLLEGDRYIEGFWQNERYFNDIKRDIISSFSFSAKESKGNRALIKKISKANSVSVHIRRGDYINNKTVSKIYNTLDKNYYKKAIKIIKRRISNPLFFIFSDDIIWAKEKFIFINNSIFVEINNGKQDYEDMRLISRCKYNIISNSTFSWWGAWLNQYPKKIVICPKRWFNNKKMNENNPSCEGWVRI